jgi:hypothetical protein
MMARDPDMAIAGRVRLLDRNLPNMNGPLVTFSSFVR